MQKRCTAPITGRLLVTLAACAAVALQLVLQPRPTLAGGVVGNGTPGSCTEAALRGAVESGGVVTFSCGTGPVTITVSRQIEIRRGPTEINGGGRVTLSGGGKTRVLYLNRARLTLRNLTIRDGRAERGAGLYGVYYADATIINSRFINNDGTPGRSPASGGGVAIRTSRLTVLDSFFEGNRGINGGGIHSVGGELIVERSTFIGNDSTAGGPLGGGLGGGGAIYVDGASYPKGAAGEGRVIIRDSVFRGNRGAAQGGAVMTFVYPPIDTVLVERSLFEQNAVVAGAAGTGSGGGLRHGGGPITVRSSLFVGNTAATGGGGFWSGLNYPGRIENTTFVDNSVRSPDGRSGAGGGLYIADGSFRLVNSTVVNNYADFFGGGIRANAGLVTLTNTMMAGNWAGDGSRPWNQCSASYTGGANNIQTASRSSQGDGDYRCGGGIRIADPLLGPLANNGGPLKTIPLLAGSPAINAGSSCPPRDARGAARIGQCDIGAFEYGSSVASAAPPAAPLLDTPAVSGQQVQLSWSDIEEASFYEVELRADWEEEPHTRASAEDEQSHLLVLGEGTYQLRVRACNTTGCGEYSAAQSATIGSTPTLEEQTFLPLVAR